MAGRQLQLVHEHRRVARPRGIEGPFEEHPKESEPASAAEERLFQGG
jgi:hypothetical protein